ncbi:hypothetical protein LVJ94_11630 [Pendulispora rubella]|uniref:Uncharacterized protein n=1 Tax=Pendulispora rubella TaxID=2741070 RepID=A0ABZ2LAT3_9BACT
MPELAGTRLDPQDSQFDFRAWEAFAGGYVTYAQGDQVEDPGRPNFDFAWIVIAGAKPPL